MTRRSTDRDEEPLSGKPIRTSNEADPAQAAPDLDPQFYPLLTGCGRYALAGTGDLRPPVPRAGSLQVRQHPSRRGNRLYYPDGRVTDLAGNPLENH